MKTLGEKKKTAHGLFRAYGFGLSFAKDRNSPAWSKVGAQERGRERCILWLLGYLLMRAWG